MTDSSVATSSSSSIKPPIRKGTLTELCSQFTTTSCNEPYQNNSNLIKIQRPISKFGSRSTGVDIIGLDTVPDSLKVQTQQESGPIYNAESSYLKRLNFEYITEARTNDSIQRNKELKQVNQATHETETDENSNSSNDYKIQDRHTHVRPSVRCIHKGFTVLMILCVLPMSSLGGPVDQYKDNGLDTVPDSLKVQTQQESGPIYDAASSYLKRLNFDEYNTETRTNDSIQRNNELKQVSQANHETATDENSNSSNDNKIQDRHTHVRSSVRCIPKGFIVLMILCVLPISSLRRPVNQYKDNDTGCRATLSDSTPDDENHKNHNQIECGITNCNAASAVIFEKTEKDTPNQWTPVFEGSSKTQYRALETLTGYTLANEAFRTDHILHINTPIPLDEGKWRCVVYEDSTAKHISPKIEVNILVRHGEGIDHETQKLYLICIVVSATSIWLLGGVLIWIIHKQVMLLMPCLLMLMIMMLTLPVAAIPQTPVLFSGYNVGHACRPQISSNTPNEDAFRQIECEISTCNATKVTYEKQINASQWIPVFEGFNKTQFRTVNTIGFNYSMTNRNDYMAFHTKHLLYIKPLILKDQGEWRCVVHDDISGDCESNAVEVNIYVTPVGYNLNIAPNNPILLTGQTEEFDCMIDGIHPEPDVFWEIHDLETLEGTSFNKQHGDGLWFVMNRLRLEFHHVGKHTLSCIVKTKTGEPWLQNRIHVDVKQSPYISFPNDERTISVWSNSSFTMDCKGSGYKPSITWQKNGTTISDTDYRYSIAHHCNDTYCSSSLTSQPIENMLTCYTEDKFEVYTCTVALEKSVNSNHTSANINVYILNPPQINGTQKNITAGQSCNVTLTCDVCRATSAVWKYNGTNVTKGEVAYLPDGSLHLHKNMRFGQYTRTVRNVAGEVNCNVYLHNSGATCKSMNYSTIIGVVSSLILLVLLVLGVALVVWRKRGTQEGLRSPSRIVLLDCELS